MKSYANHLVTTRSFGEELPKTYQPTMRSSAIFPLKVVAGKLDTVCTFMGYWLRKRNINAVTVLLTIHDENGSKLRVSSHLVDSTRSFVFRASQLVSGLHSSNNFVGSIKIDIFSAVDMVFPYPAITFAYESLRGTTFVHTCGRVYNDFDDLKSNESMAVPETGFDVYVANNLTPFFSFVNGPLEMVEEGYAIELIDEKGTVRTLERKIKHLGSYATAWLPIFENKKEKEGLSGDKLTVKIKHQFKGFFPRFVAGNVLNEDEAISLTHSYYDTSVDKTEGAIYTNPEPELFFDSVLAIPLDYKFDAVELAIYPNFALSPTKLRFELYDTSGSRVTESDEVLEIANGSVSVNYLDLLRMFRGYLEDIRLGMCKVIMDGNGRVPTRMKFGLNFVNENDGVNLPSNICFNANVPNKKIIEKPGTFRWCAVFGNDRQKIYLHNTSFIKQFSQIANVKATVCRPGDDETLTLDFELAVDGSIELFEVFGSEIGSFVCRETGWVSFECSSPFVNGYYVTDNEKGVVGADHIY